MVQAAGKASVETVQPVGIFTSLRPVVLNALLPIDFVFGGKVKYCRSGKFLNALAFIYNEAPVK